jgi:hypothetical protein
MIVSLVYAIDSKNIKKDYSEIVKLITESVKNEASPHYH